MASPEESPRSEHSFSIVQLLSGLEIWHFSLLSVIGSLVIVIGFSFFFHGRIMPDYLVVGAFTSLAISYPVIRLVRRLGEREEDFKQILDKSPDGVALVRDGRYVYVNSAWADALGHDQPAELEGQVVTELVHPEDRELIGAGIRSLEQTGVAPETQEIRFSRPDGATSTLYCRPIKQVNYRAGQANLVLARDITLERSLQAQLALSERVASLGMLAAGVGHEINNPLTFIVGNVSYLSELMGNMKEQLDGDDFAEISAALDECAEGAGRIKRIVEDLRTFSRQDVEERTRLDLREVLDHAIRMTGNEIKHHAVLTKNYHSAAHVMGGQARLTQVFVNMLINAAHAMPAGKADQNEIIVTCARTAGGGAMASIADTGAGIPPEVLPRIFDPFFTTKDVGKGTGLGLSISHDIVTNMGGTIAVDTEVGKGTTFKLTWPPLDGAPGAA